MGDEHKKRGRRPIHPGEIIREDILPSLDMSVSKFADAIGVTRKTMSALINERQGISPEMAVRLSTALGNSPRFWLNLQTSCDLWSVETPENVTQINWKAA